MYASVCVEKGENVDADDRIYAGPLVVEINLVRRVVRVSLPL